MKTRPTLTVLALNDGDDAKFQSGGHELGRPLRPIIKPMLAPLKNDNDDDVDDDEADALEASCDIGETTFRKGPMHINRTGVTFDNECSEHKKSTTTRSKDKNRNNAVKHVQDDDAKLAETRLARHTTILLDELETCGLIGRGCSGHVMRAKHKTSGQLFAIKVVNNVYDKAKRDQMLTEIRTLYSVESPFLVEFYGAYFSDHQLSLVLEYCVAGSLDAILLRRAPMPEAIVASIAFQMLQGLAHLKQTHHFHRDIKPQNTLLQSDGRVKLTDFGLARGLDHSQDMAQTFVGTFKYMSPERVQNEPYDYKSDIWSLGLVLIECATGTFPFRNARSYIDVVQSIIECAEPELPPDSEGMAFTSDFREFISDCLKKDPLKRAAVELLLESPWLERHDATDGSRCARRISEWFGGSSAGDAKSSTTTTAQAWTSANTKAARDGKATGSKTQQGDDSEEEIEELIDGA